jgi:hypothetical protein
MRENQLRNSRTAANAVVGAGVLAALGTAGVLLGHTLHNGQDQSASGDRTSQNQTFRQTTPRGDDQRGDDQGEDDNGWTAVLPPQQLAPPSGQQGNQLGNPGSQSGPQTHSSGS